MSTYYSSNTPVTKSFDVEFNDSVLDMAGWKNPRYEGSKLTARAVNVFRPGDVSYDKSPVIENKIAALYIGTTVIGGDDEDPSRVSIQGHSYLTVDKILLIDIETDDIRIIERQSLVDISTNTVGEELAFKRYVTRDFFEGSTINIRLIDRTVQNSLKPEHRVKFNRGSLMKLYEYTANKNGFEDGVFGGFGIRSNVETPFQTGSIEGRGLFGYGMTAPASRSLFDQNSIQFVDSLPSELNHLAGDINLSNMGTELAPISTSQNINTNVLAAETPAIVTGVVISTGTSTSPGSTTTLPANPGETFEGP